MTRRILLEVAANSCTMDSQRNKDESDGQLVMKENEMTIEGSKSSLSEQEEEEEEKCFLWNPLVVHMLVVIFGISAWIGVNGIYIQLPLLVITAPEKWNLAAYLVVIVQAANIGPATYTVTRKFCHLNESRCIFVLLFTGSLAMGLLAFFYKTTCYLGGTREHSVVLFVCGFLAALLGCTSSVLFMPYLRNSSERYLISYFIGEGLSGVLPSVVALLQGVGAGANSECIDYGNGTIVQVSPAEPRFSSRHYFIFIFTLLLLSLCSFRLLQYLLSIKTIKVPTSINSSSSPSPDILLITNDGQSESYENGRRATPSINNNNNNNISKILAITKWRTVYLHILVGVVCFFGNGLLPGIQTYSCLPYGNIAFHLTVTLANIANPTACLIYLWINSVNLKVLDALTLIGVIACAYVTYLALVSPKPPLRTSILGISLAVITWILLTGIISYLKLFVTSIVRQKLGPGGLLGIGIVMQLGSACGALLSFGLINYTSLFRQSKPCTPL